MNQFTTREFADPTPSAPGRRRRRWPLILTGMLVAVVVVVGVVVLVADHRQGGGPGDSDTRQGPTATGSGADFGALSWQQVGRTELPFSSTAGPRQVNGVTASGFSDTPAGAILAAWQIPIRLSLLTGTDDIYRNQVIGTDTEINAFKVAVANLQADLDPTMTVPRVLAWREHTPFTMSVASYDFALPGDTTSAVKLMRFAVVRVGGTDGDWKFQPGLYGNATSTPVDARSVTESNGWHRFAPGVPQ
ncbi:hypothetical protein LH935_28185 (plasmid) [Gordonia polyisoprenivorans]|uniref:hypothetical protein n=1 Tax=Gordonia polyisoprenivorans TaxID=84595 RepID=UPI0022344817|nr:hypothetical protein [uncultured Gordonia sp.]UZF59365.1 hypothetical protein LH935_28185 [Gordonia polyisoprenivorans]